MRVRLGKWGYGRDLFSRKTRGYVLSVHCEKDVLTLGAERVYTRELDYNANLLTLQQFGYTKQTIKGVDLCQVDSKGSASYLLGVHNTGQIPVTATIDCSMSEGIEFSTGKAKATKAVLPGQWAVLLICVTDSRAPRCSLQIIFGVSTR